MEKLIIIILSKRYNKKQSLMQKLIEECKKDGYGLLKTIIIISKFYKKNNAKLMQ